MQTMTALLTTVILVSSVHAAEAANVALPLDGPDRPGVAGLPASAWHEFEIATDSPAVLGEFLASSGLHFLHQQRLPVLRLGGGATDLRLPEAVWVKLDQPGNAVLLIETNIGTFAKVLNEATPGFPSLCPTGKRDFATLNGEPVEWEVTAIELRALWVVQDTQADAERVPGWLAVVPADGFGTGAALAAR